MIEQLVEEGYAPEILVPLRLLTHDEDVPYDDYITQIMADSVAMEVKIADLEDNSDIRRMHEIDDQAKERLQKYHKAWKRLTAKRDGL